MLTASLPLLAQPCDAEVPPLVQNATRGARAAVLRTAVRLATYPLDTIKTRQQTRVAKDVPLFSGVGLATLGQIPAGAALVGSFDFLRSSGVDRATSAFLASLPPIVLKVPFERLKQRRQIGRFEDNDLDFYRGGTAHAFRELGFNAIQLAIFDATDGEPALRGAIAAGLAAVFTHPIDVVKTVSMTDDQAAGDDLGHRKKKNNIAAVVNDLYTDDGLRAFTRGILPRALHSALGGAAFFAVAK